jgi:hypothetical protein
MSMSNCEIGVDSRCAHGIKLKGLDGVKYWGMGDSRIRLHEVAVRKYIIGGNL